jgi:hypothetical protein
MTTSYGITFDYLCPFARNAGEAVVSAIKAGADHDVRFIAFSLNQQHVAEGAPPVWEQGIPSADADDRSGVLALLWGIAVRDNFPDQFLDYHVASFAARHDQGLLIKHESVLRGVAISVGLDPDAIAAIVADGKPAITLGQEHTEMVDDYDVFGVPTFIAFGEATFIRFMERNNVEDLDRALAMLDWSRLNEFKRTRIAR